VYRLSRMSFPVANSNTTLIAPHNQSIYSSTSCPPEQNLENTSEENFSSPDSWDVVSGEWNWSDEDLVGGDGRGPNGLILSPIAADNFTAILNLRIDEANKNVSKYMSLSTERDKIMNLSSKRKKEKMRKKKYADRLQKILMLLSGSRFDKLLDLGCSDGHFSLLIKEASSAKQAFGVDINYNSVKSALERGVQAVQLDLNTAVLPFENRSFDLIVASELIDI